MSAYAIPAVEQEILDVRDLVLHGDPGVQSRVSELLHRTARLDVHARLIGAIAQAKVSSPDAPSQLDAAIRAARELPAREPETTLDLALALFLADRPDEAVDVVWQAFDEGAGDAVSPELMLAFVDQLLDERSDAAAGKLLRALYDGLISPTTTTGVPFSSEAAVEHFRSPTRRRRFLKEALRLVDVRLARGRGDTTLRIVRAGILVGLGRLDEALKTVSQVLEQRPDDDIARSLLVATLAKQESYPQAVTEFKRLPKARRAAPQALAAEANLLVQAGTPEQAVTVLESATPDAADECEVRTAHVRALAAAGRIADARIRIEALTRDFPLSPEVCVLHAEVLAQAGEVDEAITRLHSFISAGPQFGPAHTLLARLLRKAGRTEEALSAFEAALALETLQGPDQAEYATVLLELDRPVEALEVIELADPESDEVALLHAEILRALDRPDEALSWVRQVFQRSSEAATRAAVSVRMEILSGDLLNRGEYAVALETLDAVANTPDGLSPLGLGMRAECLRLAGRLQSAVSVGEDAIAKGCEEPWLFGTVAAALTDLGRARSALPVLERAFAESPDYLFGRSVEAVALCRTERVSEGIQVLDRYFPMDAIPGGWSDSVVPLRSYAILAAGRFDEAKGLLEAELDHRADDPVVCGLLGLVAARAGGLAAALAAFERAADLVGGALDPLILTEYADALTIAHSKRPESATHYYERAVQEWLRPGVDEYIMPRSRTGGAWALLRLGLTAEAIEQSKQAFHDATDPMLEQRLRLAMMFALAGEGEHAAEVGSATLSEIEHLQDRDRASAILAETIYRLDLLEHDPAWPGAVQRLEALRADVTERGEK